MMHEAGVAADDRLDRDEARQVFRRSLAMLGGHRAQLIAAASLMVLWTLTTLAGPLLIRYGIDQGITEADRGALSQRHHRLRHRHGGRVRGLPSPGPGGGPDR